MALALVVPLTTHGLLPALPVIAEDLGGSFARVQLTLSLPLLGMALANPVLG